MKKIVVPCTVVLIFAACKSSPNELKEKGIAATKAYLSVHLPQTDSMYLSMDSLNLIAIDTITEKKEIYFPLNKALGYLDLYNELTSNAISLTKSRLEIANLGAQQYPNTVSNKAEFEAVKEENAKVHMYSDSAKKYAAIIERLQAKRKVADSTHFKLYGFKFILQYTLKDRTMKKDSIMVPITEDFHVKTISEISDKYFNALH